MAELNPNLIVADNYDVMANVLKQKTERQNIKDAILANQTNQYKLDQAKLEEGRNNNLREIFSNNEADMLPGALKAGGYMKEYNDLEKTQQERAANTLKNRGAELDIAKKKNDLSGQAMGYLMKNPTDENLQATLKGLVDNGVMSAEEAQAAYDKGPKDPAGIKQLATQHYTSSLATKDQLEKFSTQNNGATNDVVGTDPVTGATRTVQSTPITQSANNIANNERITKEGQLNRDVTMRGQNMTSQTASNRLNATQGTNVDGTPQYSNKPLPASALKLQNEGLEALSIASNIDKDLGVLQDQMKSGKLKVGLLNRAEASVRNATNSSNENSRNLASFRTTLEKLRNDSLRLNKGVQTEGDAQRIWNEIFGNIDDQKYVEQRLAELKVINQRAVDLHKFNVDNIRSNYNAQPMDYTRYENQPAAVGAGSILPKDAKLPAKQGGKVKTADDFFKVHGL